MRALSLKEVERFSEGDLTQGREERVVLRVTTDSRSVQPGDLFVALRGDRFDGHDYLEEVAQKGAVAAIVDRGNSAQADLGKGFGIIRVKDSYEGLQALAKGYRESLKIRIIGVTGSCGKTSTKEFIGAILRKHYQVGQTKGNLNNHIGVPLTLLSLEDEDDFGIIEMGMNQPGEIAKLAELAQPDIGVITNVGWAHVEQFKNQDAIGDEKGSLFRAVHEEGFCVLSGDDERCERLRRKFSGVSYSAGRSGTSDYVMKDVRLNGNGMSFQLSGEEESISVQIGYPGVHMAQNAALAAVVGLHCEISKENISEALEEVKIPGGRLEVKKVGDSLVMDDTYNANPDSMKASFQTMKLLSKGEGFTAVLGDMGELGGYGEKLHKWVGECLAQEGGEDLWTYGEFKDFYASGARQGGVACEHIHTFDEIEELNKEFQKEVAGKRHILVKGSRAAGMERVLKSVFRGEW